jgi:WD40 repeat protein
MSTDQPNPYIGPRTFRKEEGDRFFGRDRETADLEALVISEKLVLFYAQSGAGKSSLINARLIPSLERKERPFEVLPVARLGGDTAVGAEVENIYIFNLFRSLHRRESDPELFRALTLSDFLKKLTEDKDGYFYDPNLTQSLRDPKPWPRMLIIDQFEEIFSTNVEAWQKREEFFRQMAQAMQDDPFLWVLLVMREDFIAALDPYAHLLPKGLRARYYMERLSHEAAVKAIRSPVEKQRPYAEGVAEKLAEDLSRVKVQKQDGTTGTDPGQYIEPVQLQVVCYSLWENLPSEGTEITEQDLQDVGDVNQSLARYYDQRVSEVARTKDVQERRIRDWFEKKLITEGGIRNMVIQERETPPGGLDDEVIRALQSDLVRAEKRGGTTWYELTHDRLVEPVLASNKKWFELNLSPLQRQALLWEDQDRNDNWLLRDRAYTEVLPWVAEHQDELTSSEREFLDDSRKQRDRAERTRRFTAAITVFAAIAVIGLILAIISTANANAAKRDASNQASTASVAEAQAIVQRNVAVTAQAIAKISEEEAQKQAKISRAGQLAAQSVSLRDKNFLISLLLGVEAFKRTNEQITSVQAQSALLENTQANPKLDQFLSGNTGPVVSAVFSPDGKTLASGTYGHDILLWDVKTRQLMDKLIGHTDIIRSIAFDRDGNMMASGSEDQTVILWDMKTGHPVHTMRGHSNAVTTVAFSPDGKTLASGSEDTTVMLWDVETGQPISTMSKHSRKVRSVAFSPDGKTLASGSDDGTIILSDVKTGIPIRNPLIEPSYLGPNPVLSVAFSPDGATLASGSYNGPIILWDVKTRQPINTLSGHPRSVRSVAFSPDGKTLASGSADTTIILWDMESGQIRDQLRGHSDMINSLSFSSDSSRLASGSADTTIVLWDMAPRQPLARLLSGFAHAGPVLSIAFSPDGKTLASGSYDKTIMLWDVEKGQAFDDKPLFEHTDVVRSVAFSPDGRTLASGSEDKTIILWDVEKSQTLGQPLRGHTASVTSVAFSPDGKMLASGSEDKTIILWDMKTRQPIGKPLSGHFKRVTSVAFSPDGETLVSGSDDTTIILWDVKKGQAIFRLRGHSYPINSLAFSPDGKMLASGSYDGSIILWDVKKGRAIVTWTGPLYSINSLAFSPDGKTLALGSDDQTVMLWDVKTHQPIISLSGHSAPVQSVAFSPDGKTLASGSFNIILWDLNEKSWTNESCQRAGRNFTFKEWELYFPTEDYGKTCDEFPSGPSATPTGTS